MQRCCSTCELVKLHPPVAPVVFEFAGVSGMGNNGCDVRELHDSDGAWTQVIKAGESENKISIGVSCSAGRRKARWESLMSLD